MQAGSLGVETALEAREHAGSLGVETALDAREHTGSLWEETVSLGCLSQMEHVLRLLLEVRCLRIGGAAE